MRRMLKMLARLYPGAWRIRYGAEYEALIEDAPPRARDAFDVAWGAMKMRASSRNFVRIVLPCALAGALLGLAISFSRPAVYHSRALITVNSDSRVSIDDGLRDLVQEAFATSFLQQLIQNENLYPRERARMPMSDVVNMMRKGIWLRPLKKSNGKPAMGFVVEFYYPDPHLAQRVDAELVSQMMALNLRMRITAASATTDFLQEQLALATNPAIRGDIQSKLEQAQAATSHMPEVFRVEKAASLPNTPDGWGPARFSAVGVLAGLIAGLIAAAVLGSRQRAISD